MILEKISYLYYLLSQNTNKITEINHKNIVTKSTILGNKMKYYTMKKNYLIMVFLIKIFAFVCSKR